jgi:hypothetical protein
MLPRAYPLRRPEHRASEGETLSEFSASVAAFCDEGHPSGRHRQRDLAHSAEQRDDLAGEAADRILVVGFARDGDDEVVDAGIDHGL